MNGLRQLPSDEYYQLPPPGYPFPPFQEEKEVHLRDYWRVIWKRRWMIVAVFLVVVIFTVVKTITTRPVYRGTATIQINIENPQIVDFKEIFTVNMWAMDYYQTQYRVLESRNLAKRVVQKLRLSEHPEFLPESPSAFQRLKSGILSPLRNAVHFIRSWTTSSRGISSGQTAESNQEASEIDRDAPYAGALLARLRIDPIKESRLVRIHFESYHPELAGQVPNVLAEEYIQLSQDSRITTTEQAKEWLGKQLEDLKAKVEKAEEALQEFGSKNDIISSLDEKDNVTLRRLSELNDALAKAEADRMAKEALYKQVRQEKNITSDAIPAVLENKLIQELKQNYIQLEAQYMRLSETFKSSHPEMIRLKNQMDTTQKRLSLEINKVIGSIKNEYEASLRNESLLRAAFEQQRGKTLEMQQKSIQYNILKREADTNKDLYKSLLQRMKEVGVTAGYNTSNIQLLDRAEIPQSPYMPDRNRNILLAAVIGLFLGVGLAFFLEHLDNTVKTPDDVEQFLRLPSFGMVPAISCEPKRGRISMRTSSSGKSYPVEFITHHSPRSLMSEAYRNIRTSILLSFSEQPPKKIAVTSPNPLEGKTTTLINTAISLSQTGARVLIVDGDMRRPRIHKVFGNGNGTGLSNFLSGNAKLWTVIRKSEIPNVYYIPAGSIPPNPAELLGSNLFRDMIQALGEKFDHILIDAPPVVGFADSVVLSSVVDGVILVVTGGRTPKIALQRAKDALHQVNAKILGVVINRVNIHQVDYNDYYYRYEYYYGEEAPKKALPYKSSKREIPSRRESSSRRISSHR